MENVENLRDLKIETKIKYKNNVSFAKIKNIIYIIIKKIKLFFYLIFKKINNILFIS